MDLRKYFIEAQEEANDEFFNYDGENGYDDYEDDYDFDMEEDNFAGDDDNDFDMEAWEFQEFRKVSFCTNQ